MNHDRLPWAGPNWKYRRQRFIVWLKWNLPRFSWVPGFKRLWRWATRKVDEMHDAARREKDATT